MSDISIYEVGPRDGLQNIQEEVPTSDKIDLINRLYHAGLQDIEIASFVHPKLVPNMADAEEVFTATKDIGNFGVLVPNQKGFDRAKAVGAEKLNVFFSASDMFNQANLGKKMDDIVAELDSMLEGTDTKNVRAYISCAFGAPNEKVNEGKLLEAMQVAQHMADTVVLCDTIGVAHPSSVYRTLELSKHIDSEIALHLHHKKDKKDNMFPNIQSALDWGITQFDASIGGLGGCPFIPGSGSNLSTNDMVRFLHKNDYETGLDIWELDAIANVYASEQIIPHTPIRLRVKNKLEEIFNNSPMSSKW
jgi:hydroxymethylglutaryl-CoA lyase